MGKAKVSDEVRFSVIARAGYKCEICGGTLSGIYGMSVHHRKPRGMGGTKNLSIHLPSNLMAICGSGTSGCHGALEINRSDAYEKGWLVHRGDESSKIPALIYDRGILLLDDLGGYLMIGDGNE